eukprot:Sdes_comp21223_c0_seq1m19876
MDKDSELKTFGSDNRVNPTSQSPGRSNQREVKFDAAILNEKPVDERIVKIEDPITITFEDLNYSVSSKVGKIFQKKIVTKELLKGVTGSIKPGEMTALMGPSGAGKSTLLDVIAGRKSTGTITGSLLFNGKERRLDFNRICGYVQQKDILLGALTVRSLLQYCARLRLPVLISEEVKNKKVEEIIVQLDLQNCANVVIGTAKTRGISGGQAKRVNIAIELITSPSILFLDEPTSGLDSATSFEIMKTVRRICESGVSVVCTIHQPSSDIFRLFDRLLLLVDGETVYLGSALKAQNYCEELGYTKPDGMNAPDFIIAVVSRDQTLVKGPDHPPNFFAQIYKESALAQLRKISTKRAVETTQSIELKSQPVLYINSASDNTKTLISRVVAVNRSSPGYLLKRVIATVFVALVFLTVYRNSPKNDQGERNLFSILVLSLVFFLFVAHEYIGPIIEERLFVERERSSAAYQSISYYLSHVVVEFPISLLRTFFWSIIIYFGVGLEITAPQFFFFWLIVLIVADLGFAIAQFSSALSPTEDVAAAAMASIPPFLLIFSGFFIERSQIPYHWIWAYYCNFIQYGFAALVINQFRYNDSYRDSQGNPVSGASIVEQFGFQTSGFFADKWANFLLVIIIWFILRFVTFLAYAYAKPNKQ